MSKEVLELHGRPNDSLVVYLCGTYTFGMKRKSAISDELLGRIRARRTEGASFQQLAAEFKIHEATLRSNLMTRGGLPEFERTCSLVECGRRFRTTNAQRVFCSRRHARLASARRVLGKDVQMVECALPECSILITAHVNAGEQPGLCGSSYQGRRFCGRMHSDLHNRRVQTGWYARLLGQGPACEVCGHLLALDLHHEVYDTKTGSDLSGPTHWLCPTHHALIHRGYAAYKEGNYVLLVDLLKARAQQKSTLFANYFGSITPVGDTWAAK